MYVAIACLIKFIRYCIIFSLEQWSKVKFYSITFPNKIEQQQ